jgi:hypothetical protein
MVDWLQTLNIEIAKSNISRVAKQLGYSRTTISLVVSGDYDASTDKIADAVRRNFSNQVECPHLNCVITLEACKDCQSRKIPQSNARALRHWRACQTCIHKISDEEERQHA